MARDIDIGLLRAFTAVVQTGSVTGAARLLNRTQAAVSQQIKRLEELLGAELFMRDHKRLTLAGPGERLLSHAKRLIALNDEVWGLMTKPSFAGSVRLGIPCDIVPTYAPQILRRFAQAWPHVQVSLETCNSNELLEFLDAGEIDLTLTTELAEIETRGETLRLDRLAWVRGRDSEAHLRSPLPISVGGPTCRFRPVVLDALRAIGRDWRFVLEVSNQDAVNATVTAGLSIGVVLQDSVPADLEILAPGNALPELPVFAINLYLPKAGAGELALELARHIRADFLQRFGAPLPLGPTGVAPVRRRRAVAA